MMPEIYPDGCGTTLEIRFPCGSITFSQECGFFDLWFWWSEDYENTAGMALAGFTNARGRAVIEEVRNAILLGRNREVRLP